MLRQNAWERLENSLPRVLFGDVTLDKVIGGINRPGVTELSGEAGCGKTQFLCYLSLICQIESHHGGLGGKSMYLYAGEGGFPDKRLLQLAEEIVRAKRTDKSATQLLNDISTLPFHNPDEAVDLLNHEIPKEIARQKGDLKLLVIDSIAGLIRTEFDQHDFDKYDIIFKIGSQLKWIADTYGIAVVVANHVKALGDSDDTTRLEYDATGRSALCMGTVPFGGAAPTLGYTWAHCLSTRIRLSKSISTLTMGYSSSFGLADDTNRTTDDDGNAGRRQLRSLYLEFDPVRPPAGCLYEIKRGGVFGVHNSEVYA